MNRARYKAGFALVFLGFFVTACGFFGDRADREPVETRQADEIMDEVLRERNPNRPQTTIWDYLRNRNKAGQIGAVNKYIWNAALETLDFLPVESVDPFTGVITTGFGTPPGGGRA